MIPIVVGAGFGDEGKGQTVSNIIELCKGSFDCVIRFNGGHQAGHTVTYGGVRHVFSNFAAGTLQGLPSYWSRFCTVHPKGILNEYEVLRSLGVTPTLFIDPLCPITLPCDIIRNRSKAKHGSVGVGFGETIERNERHFKLLACDLLDFSALQYKLENIHNYYARELSSGEFYEGGTLYEEINRLLNLPRVQIARPDTRYPIFEGAQGIMLDQDFGFFPNVTRSKTTSRNALQLMSEIPNLSKHKPNVIFVTRPYSTRHGAGPLPYEEYAHLLKLRPDLLETNQTHNYQGEFRKTILNIDLLIHAINCDWWERQDSHLGRMADSVLEITCQDHLDEADLKVVHKGVVNHATFEYIANACRQISEVPEKRLAS